MERKSRKRRGVGRDGVMRGGRVAQKLQKLSSESERGRKKTTRGLIAP